jgi:hypothetical protein
LADQRRCLARRPEHNQLPDDLADAVAILVAVNEAGMGNAAVVKGDEIGVVREENPALSVGMGELHGINRPKQPRFGGRRDVDAAQAQTIRHGAPAGFIQVEPYRLRHRL